MINLSVNLNKVALLRNQRNVGIPSVTQAAEVCVQAGAQGITVHPRPDERHVRGSDVHQLGKMLTVEFNIEGNPLQPHLMPLLRAVVPTQTTLVPDDPTQATSDHGWDLEKDGAALAPIVRELKGLGCRVSLFMDAVPEKMSLAKEMGADRVELYTEPYARAFSEGETEAVLRRYVRAAEAAQDVGLEVNAGHDLNLANLPLFCTALPNLAEVSIGHALIADALLMGLERAVEEYLRVLRA